MKLSKHSKQRMRERTNLNHNERKELFRQAMLHGKTANIVKGEKTKKYLMSKVRYNSMVRLYNGYVFIYSKNSHRLYTMYELPKKLLEEEDEVNEISK